MPTTNLRTAPGSAALPLVRATTPTGHTTYVPVWLPVRRHTTRGLVVGLATVGPRATPYHAGQPC